MVVWHAEELARFLDFTKGDCYESAWVFLPTTGSRPGEALGLRWTDVARRHTRHRYDPPVRAGIAMSHRREEKGKTKTGITQLIELDTRTVDTLTLGRRVKLRNDC